MSNRYRIALTVLASALAAAAGLAIAPPAQALGQAVVLRSYASGLCAVPLGLDNGAPVVQTRCDYNSTAHWWVRISLGNGYELLQNAASAVTHPPLPMCLDVTDGGDTNGTPLQVWQCTSTPGMNWRFDYRGSGGEADIDPLYNVRSRIGGKCLDVPAASLVDGLQLQIWTCSAGMSNAAQLWRT